MAGTRRPRRTLGTPDAESTPRHVLAGLLGPLLPAGWEIIPWQDNLARDALERTSVMLKQRVIKPAKAAPRGAHEIEFTVTIATAATTDPGPAEDALDDAVNALITAISLAGISWESATKVLVGAATTGYDLTVSLVSQPTTTTKE